MPEIGHMKNVEKKKKKSVTLQKGLQCSIYWSTGFAVVVGP